MQTDPVCRMQVEPERAAARAEHKDMTYYFCSRGCRRTFVANPDKYARASTPTAAHGAGPQHHA